MALLQKYYPDEDHVLIFDNMTTHLKHPEGSLSALKMPKNPSANFMVEVNDLGPDGKLIYTPDGKYLKKKVRMGNGKFADGTEQAFYWASDSDLPHAGEFKGMATILEEQGFKDVSKMKAQCKKKFSDCPPRENNCCCCCMLFNQPDFINVKSIFSRGTPMRMGSE